MNIAKRKPNWLPLPRGAKSLEVSAKSPECKGMFPMGKIVRFLPNSRFGKIKIKNDTEVLFSMNELEVIPREAGARIKEGLEVGYDLSLTSKGKKIIKIRVFK